MNSLPPVVFFFAVFNFLFHSSNRGYDTVHRITVDVSILADTNYGRVRGCQQYGRGKKIFRFFRGIPFAKPPVGKLRFEPPQPHPGWKRVLDASMYGSECIQVTLFTPKEYPLGSEDCLYLNIATRKSYLKGETPKGELRPVIFWIHGGFFMEGSSNFYPPDYFMEQDVVFVSTNYRLSSFGFMNTGEGTVAGNMGLKDQSMALKWVKENIQYFNGDPERIVLLGESAGGVSVHLHTLSPMSRGLFSGAISMGGTALSPWQLNDQYYKQPIRMSRELKCGTHNITRIVNCLKRLPAEQIAAYHHNVLNGAAEGKGTLFVPTIESTNSSKHPPFLDDHPLRLLQQGKVSPTPWINGVNSAEGAIYLLPIMNNDTLRRLVNRKWGRYAPICLMYRDHPSRRKISSAVRKHYMKGEHVSSKTILDAINMTSDRGFFLDSHRAALLHAKAAPTYVYYYEYEGLLSISALIFDKTNFPFLPNSANNFMGSMKTLVTTNILGRKSKIKYGAGHGDELPLLFPWPPLRKYVNQADVDYEFSMKLVLLWISFAEKGYPDPSVVGQKIKWPPVNATNPNFQDIPLKRLALNRSYYMIEEPFFKGLNFWRQYNIE